MEWSRFKKGWRWLGEKCVTLEVLGAKEGDPGEYAKRLWYEWFAHKIDWCYGS